MAFSNGSARESDKNLEFFKSMPKIELHAHLNGSISKETLRQLIDSHAADQKELFETFKTSISHGESLTLEQCFQMFKIVQSVVNSEAALYKATCDVIREFADDGVVYLELRSTPRANPATGLTKRSYLKAILRAISDCSGKVATGISSGGLNTSSCYPITVRLLVSIDRRGTVDEAADTVRLASELRSETNGLVVGIDLSGDGAVNDARDFIPVLEQARALGFRLTIHIAEVSGHGDETAEILKFSPDRIGHGTFIHPQCGGTMDLFDLASNKKVPLELCLASNIKSEVHPSYYDHHFKLWYNAGHPVCICTDDKAVFATSLSEEYAVASATFAIDKRDLWNLNKKSVNYIFAEDAVLQFLTELMNGWESALAKDAQ